MTEIPKSKRAPAEAHLQIDPVIPREGRDITEYARTMLPNGSTVTKMQFRFIEKFFELDYDGPKAVIMAGFQTQNPNRKAETLLAIPAISDEIIRRMVIKRQQFNLELDDVEKEMWSSAKETGEDTSHSARVSALAHLMRARGAFERQGDKKSKTPVAVNIDFGPMLGEEDEEEYNPTEPHLMTDEDYENS